MIWPRNNLQSLLSRYLAADGPEETRLLEELGREIEAAIGRQLRRFSLPNGEDVARDCIVAVLESVHKSKTSGECKIGNLDAFVSRAAINHAYDEIRHENPDRRRIQYRLEHLLNGRLNALGLAIWADRRTGRKAAGFAAWKGRKPGSPRHTLDDPSGRDVFAERWFGGRDPRNEDVGDLACAVLSWHGGPMLLDALVDLVCNLAEVKRKKERSLDEELEKWPDGHPLSADTSVNVEEEVVSRLDRAQMLRRGWPAMRTLAEYQLIAVCLGLETDEFVTLAAAVGYSELAAALGMELDELGKHLGDLPLPDKRIAQIVSRKPDQIASVRKKALQRIARNTRGLFADEWQ
jgi:hypothetical protein